MDASAPPRSPSHASGPASATTSGPASALGLLLLRLGLVAVASVAAWLVLRGVQPDAAYPPSSSIATLTLLPINVFCLWWTARLLHREGATLRGLFAPRTSVWVDLAWGLLWIVVLYVPFALAITGTMWLLYGNDAFTHFETVFFDPNSASIRDPGLGLALGILMVLTFAPLNAPAEEAVFRGYAQSRLGRAWTVPVAMLVASLAFGLQHVFFAPTAAGMLVYVVAFTVWGFGSALIVQRQGRLLPITLAHFVVNLFSSAPAAIFPAVQLAGVVPGGQ